MAILAINIRDWADMNNSQEGQSCRFQCCLVLYCELRHGLSFEPAVAHTGEEASRAVPGIPIKAKQVYKSIVLSTPHHLVHISAEDCQQ